MIRTYLYNTQQGTLQELAPEELLAGAPDEAALAQKNSALSESKFEGAAFRGQPRCGQDQFMWVDVTAPTPEDFELLGHRFALHPLVLEDIQAAEGRPKLHNYNDYLYLIFFAVHWDGGRAGEARQEEGARFELRLNEIDCLVGADFIVTIHPEPLAPFDDLRDRWLKRPEMMKAGTGYLLYELIDEVLDDYFPLLDALDERIDEFEEQLFQNDNSQQSRGISSQIFALKRSLIAIRRVAGPTRDVVNILLRHDADTGGKNFAYFQDLYDHSSRIVDMIDNFREIVAGALDAYLATESNRMNQVMKTLTACSIILLVPNLMAAIYGMNFENMPELKTHDGYFVVIGAMVTFVLGLFAYFKRLGWL